MSVQSSVHPPSPTSPVEVKAEVDRLRAGLDQAHRRPVAQTVQILAAAAKRLSDTAFRASFVPQLARSMEHGEALVRHEIDLVCRLLERDYLFDLLKKELGSADILDRWVTLPQLKLRRHPLGLILHNLAGNALVVAPLSIALGLLTKNCNLVKAPSQEPLFPTIFADLLFDIAPELRSEISVCHWSGQDTKVYAELFPHLDGVIHWGGEESRLSISHLAAEHDVPLVSHGPKISFAFLDGPTQDDIPRLAAALAQDVITWEQRACASPRFVFVRAGNEGAGAPCFAQALAAALADHGGRWPPGHLGKGAASRLAGVRQAYRLQLGMTGKGRVIASKDAEWTVLLSEDPPDTAAINHCMNRCIWVSPVTGGGDILSYLGKAGRPFLRLLQVLAYHGNDEAFVDAATRLGVARVSDVGAMSAPPPGASHDGEYDLARLSTIHSAPL